MNFIPLERLVNDRPGGPGALIGCSEPRDLNSFDVWLAVVQVRLAKYLGELTVFHSRLRFLIKLSITFSQASM